MCGRTASDLSRDDLARMLEIDAGELHAPELPRSWGVAPGQLVYAVQMSPGGRRCLVTMRWGLVPAWSKGRRGGGLVNARSETVLDKPAFHVAAARGRVLLPVSGFYEWHRAAPGRPRPYYFCRADGKPMALAGICEPPMGGPEGATCAVLTTAANSRMARVHDRMPVILGPRDWDEWLSHEPLERDRLGELTTPAPDSLLVAHPLRPGGIGGGPDLTAAVDTAALPSGPPQEQLSLGFPG